MSGNFTIDSLPKLTDRAIRLALAQGRNVGSDDFTLNDGAWGDGDVSIETPTVDGSGSPAAVVCQWKMDFDVPREAVVTDGLRSDESGLTLDWPLYLKVQRTGSPAVALTIDVEVYNLSRQDGAGANLVSSGSYDLKAAGTGWQSPSFTVDGSDFQRGDRLSIIVRASADDTGGTGGGEAQLEDAYFLGQYMRDA